MSAPQELELLAEQEVESALTRFRLATEGVTAARDELEAARKALEEAHRAAAIKPDLEEWREVHDRFCLEAGYCFTSGSTDCPTRARIHGLKAVAPLIVALRARMEADR